MSGYFARLLTRAQQPAPSVRPQTALPFAAPLRAEDPAALDVVRDVSAMERGDAASSTFAMRDERPHPERTRASAEWGATEPPIARARSGSDAASTIRPRGDAPPMQGEHASSEAREHAASDERASRGTDSAPAARTTAPADDGGSRREDSDFRLLPPRSDADPMHGRTLGGAIDRGVFAGALNEARAQIARQLAAERATPSEVHVTIGRIEVTAAPAATAAPTSPRKTSERAPTVTLEQYLASRARRNS